MQRIEGGQFRMGAPAYYPEESPERLVSVATFDIDITPVTNQDYEAFVRATGYVTVCERIPNEADYPGILEHMKVPGSLVFQSPQAGTGIDPDGWWHYVHGADWRRPYGPGSSIEEIPDHPVVHIAWEDAVKFASWAEKRLPTEIEAEFASRGGLKDAPYAWGHELLPNGSALANFWLEGFPFAHPERQGPPYTTGVRQYPPNGYGLFDMIGNVWEWTSTYADVPLLNPDVQCCPTGAFAHPSERKVLKGGSHLCAPDYCRRYRPAARWFQPVDTSTSHVGFRCVRSVS